MSTEKMIQPYSDSNTVDVDATAPTTAVALSVPISMEKRILLKFDDGRMIELDDATAFMSKRLKFIVSRGRMILGINFYIYCLGSNPDFSRIPFELVEKVFDYCRRHAHAGPDDDLNVFDQQYYHLDDAYELCRLAMAALRFEVDSLKKLALSATTTVLSRRMPLPQVTLQQFDYVETILREF